MSAAFLVAAGAAVILGTVLNWVTIEQPPILPVDQVDNAQPFSGLETRSAPFLLIAAGAVILLALLLVMRRKAIYAWGAFVATIVIGAIAFQNYRGINELFYEQMNGVGEPDPALGLMLVAAGGVIGLIASAGAISSIPPQSRE